MKTNKLMNWISDFMIPYTTSMLREVFVFVCFCGGYRPSGELFTHMETRKTRAFRLKYICYIPIFEQFWYLIRHHNN